MTTNNTLNAEIIKQHLDSALAKKVEIAVFNTVSSTQDVARDYCSDKPMVMVLCEQQTQGRGRLQRPWFSPFGQNIYSSYRIDWLLSLDRLNGLSLVMGLAVIETLKEIAHLDLKLKWPNDVYHEHQKISGNLIDIVADKQWVIIGVGINVNMQAVPKSSALKPWTSLHKICGHVFDRNVISAVLIKQLSTHIERFKAKGLAVFFTAWQQVDYLVGKAITFTKGDKIIDGIARGIDTKGRLLLSVDGKVESFSAGEVQLKKHVIVGEK